MKRCALMSLRVVSAIVLATLGLCFGAGYAGADTLMEPRLVLREIKITGDEFVVLQNTGSGDIADLSAYWLGYSGNDLSTAPPTQQLPPVSLAAGKVMLLSGGGTLETCDANYLAKLSLSLSDSKGTLAIWYLNGSSFNQLAGAQTNVTWSKSTKTKPIEPGHDIDLYAESSLTNPAWYYDEPNNAWAAANLDAGCTFSVPGDTPGSTTTVVSWPQNTDQPPAVIEALADDGPVVAGPVLPAADIGLKPPQLTELLPNPAGTGTDATDEFIELYNPNTSAFDLSGFTLQTGLTTKHKYVFPQGTLLPAKSFGAFYSKDTGLSLSNTSSQAELVDPFGTVIAQSEMYSSANDGLSWSLANGEWYWTNTLTPGKPNVINQAVLGKATTKAAVATKLSSGTNKSALTATSTASNQAPTDSTAVITPIHPGALAAVAVAAVAYGLYEYRHDVANKLYQFRRYREARRKDRR